MSDVLQFRRRGASREVVNKLLELGYLTRAMRHRAGAIEDALARLQADSAAPRSSPGAINLAVIEQRRSRKSVHKIRRIAANVAQASNEKPRETQGGQRGAKAEGRITT
jgi:hypothetical protein